MTKAQEWLTGRMFGMPRWVWLSLLLAAIALGLYLRSRDTGEIPEDDSLDIEPEDTLDSAAQYDGGLAGVGLLGPPAGSVIPVNAPVLPEGLTDLYGSLGDVIGALGGAIVDRDIETGTGEGITGGGPPSVPETAHTPQSPKCTATDRARIAALTAQMQAANNRLQRINKHAMPKAQDGYAQARRKGASGEGWMRQIRSLRNERDRLQDRRGKLSKQRAPIQARCRA